MPMVITYAFSCKERTAENDDIFYEQEWDKRKDTSSPIFLYDVAAVQIPESLRQLLNSAYAAVEHCNEQVEKQNNADQKI